MEHVLLKASKNIDSEKEWGINYLTSIENCYSERHSHDFYELLLITEGYLLNEVNGKETLLQKGSLVFFRPFDVHQLKQYKDQDCRFINLTFLSKTVKALWNYMGDELDMSRFITSLLPPCLTLTENQLFEISSKFNQLSTIPSQQKKLSRTIMRMILIEVYFKYLPLVWEENKNKIPGWLNALCLEMKQKENFEQGVEALLYLSRKNHSYLCRTFRKYLNTTPTEYINQIRLDYAENLLLNSDINITEICYNTGFESLSHFYTLFEHRFKMTPLKYRKKYWSSVHRW